VKPTVDRRAALFLAALACMLFGFAPLVVLAFAGALEFAWLLAHDAQSLALSPAGLVGYVAGTAREVFYDWASLYGADGQSGARIFIAQCTCALVWCAYLARARRSVPGTVTNAC